MQAPEEQVIETQAQQIAPGLHASCPLLCVPARNTLVPLKILNANYKIDCQIATAFVKLEMTVKLDSKAVSKRANLPLVLFLPKHRDASVTDVTITSLSKNAVFFTAVVPNEKAEEIAGSKAARKQAEQAAALLPQTEFTDPCLFHVVIGSCKVGESLKVELQWFQPLEFVQGWYRLLLPTTIPQAAWGAPSINQIISMKATLSTGMPDMVQYNSPSHYFMKRAEEPGLVELDLDTYQPLANRDVDLQYHLWGDVINANIVLQPPKKFAKAAALPNGDGKYSAYDVDLSAKDTNGKDMMNGNGMNGNGMNGMGMDGKDMNGKDMNGKEQQQQQPIDPDEVGTFALTVSPPAPDFAPQFPRSVVFLIDHSGSMTGEPMQYAKDAIIWGIRELAEADSFNIIAFNHVQVAWQQPGVVPATPENKQAAIDWIAQYVHAEGGTDIETPLFAALEMLKVATGLPYVFLLTDGAVNNEQSIARRLGMLQNQARAENNTNLPRVSTFAIGPYCNHYFLKQLAIIGRGQFDVAFRPIAIQLQMQKMLQAAAKPCLADVVLQIDNVQGVELYPFPLPDLFCGMPLVVSGKYMGEWPTSIGLTGRLPNGETWTQHVTFTPNRLEIPLDKVFIRQRLDVLTARAWLENNNALRDNVVEYSLQHNVPCAYTTTVGVSTTKEKYEEMQQQAHKPGSMWNTPAGRTAMVVGASVGGIVIIGGAALAFGSIAATLAGTSMVDVLGQADFLGAIGGVFDGGCCDGCGDVCGSIFDCCGSCDGCDAICDGIGDGLGDVLEACGHLCDCLCSLLGSL